MKPRDLLTIASEYGLGWLANRCLYSMKLGMLRHAPSFERFFESACDIKRINLFDNYLGFEEVRQLLLELPECDRQSLLDRADKAIEGRILAF